MSGGPRQLGEGGVVQLVKRAMHRRVTGHVTEEVSLQAQVLDVRATLATAGNHERHLSKHLAAVVHRKASHVGHDARATRFHHYAIGRSNLHLGSALLFEESGCVNSTSFPCEEGFSVDGRTSAHEAS